MEMYSTSGWTFGWDAMGREIEVEVEMPAQRVVACKARCHQGWFFPSDWDGELHDAWNAGDDAEIARIRAERGTTGGEG